MKPNLHVNPRAFSQWQLQRYAPAPPYKITKTGRVWIITPKDNDRLNIAHGLGGMVLFSSEYLAQYVLSVGLLPAN